MASAIPIRSLTPREDWETPDALFRALDSIFHFDFDAAAHADNAKCEKFISRGEDARFAWWPNYGQRAFLNPPYGRGVRAFLEAAVRASERGVGTVALLPARTDTEWWYDLVGWRAQAIWFLKGRLRFGKATNSAPFPSALVLWQPRGEKPLRWAEWAQRQALLKEAGFPSWGVCFERAAH